MKILHVITSLRTGGAEKLMVDVLPRLRDKGHEVDLLLFDGTETPFRHQLEAAGIKVYDLGKGRSVYSPLNLIRLIPYLRKYDIVHTHNTAPQLYAAIGSVLCSVVLCTTEHNTSNRRRDWKWYAAIDRWMYNRYRKVICISEKTEKHLRRFLGDIHTDICIINNGIDVAKYRNTNSANLAKESFGCKIALIQVAGFRYQKDQDTAIRSLIHLPEEVHLFLVGDGERRDELGRLVKESNLEQRVHFLGIRTDVQGLLKIADIVIMSSHWEGFGLAAVEGMAAGKPVIASDVDGLREVVKGYGVLFPHENEHALANEIIMLSEDKAYYQKVVSKCRQRANDFDISKMVEGYEKVYRKILNEK